MGRGGHGGGGFGGHGGGGFGHGGFGHGGFGHGGLFWGPGFGMYGPMWMGLWFGPPWMRGPLIFYLVFVLLYALGMSVFYYWYEEEHCARECETMPSGREWCDWRCDDQQLVGYFGFGWFCALLLLLCGGAYGCHPRDGDGGGEYVAVVDEAGGGGQAHAMGTPVAYAEPAYQQSDANPF